MLPGQRNGGPQARDLRYPSIVRSSRTAMARSGVVMRNPAGARTRARIPAERIPPEDGAVPPGEDDLVRRFVDEAICSDRRDVHRLVQSRVLSGGLKVAVIFDEARGRCRAGDELDRCDRTREHDGGQEQAEKAGRSTGHSLSRRNCSTWLFGAATASGDRVSPAVGAATVGLGVHGPLSRR